MKSSWIPLDIRLGLTRSLTSQDRLKWGICGTGRVCADFVQALKSFPNADVTCVSARRKERAQMFAELHGIPSSFGSFEEMATKGDFDVMYIGTLHPFHREQAEAALHAGKHVLVEKPVTTNYADAKALVDLAQATQRFFSEGIWTRYFPAVEEARRLLDERVIDEVMMVQADFGFDAGDTGDSEDSDFFNPSLGGGCTNYVTVYPISHITFALGPHPTIMSAIGSIHPDRKVDLNNSVSLAYPARKIAVAISSVTAETPEETHIIGKKGRITINTPAHCPTSYTLSIKNSGRGDIGSKTYNFDLPPESTKVSETGGFVYPNSIGFQYEAAAVTRCILNGLLETPQYPNEEMLGVHRILEKVRADIGIS